MKLKNIFSMIIGILLSTTLCVPVIASEDSAPTTTPDGQEIKVIGEGTTNENGEEGFYYGGVFYSTEGMDENTVRVADDKGNIISDTIDTESAEVPTDVADEYTEEEIAETDIINTNTDSEVEESDEDVVADDKDINDEAEDDVEENDTTVQESLLSKDSTAICIIIAAIIAIIGITTGVIVYIKKK